MVGWLSDQRGVYFRNANSIKDYRIQLRSKKVIWYWGIYLGVLILVALSNYGSIAAGSGGSTPSQVQASLTTYYQVVTGFIQVAILLIAALLAASTIVSEYELHSMELVQITPKSTKYFLVGKYMAVMRQVALMLFLAMPIAAVGVTLGGATWAQILEQFGYLFMQAGLATAIAMPLAIASKSVVRTVSGYLGILFVMSLFLFSVGATFAATGVGMVPPFAGLIPFVTLFVTGTMTPVFGVEVPNWLLCMLITLIFVKMFLLGAGSAMTRVGSKETISLRIHGLVLVGLYALLFGYSYWNLPSVFVPGPDRLIQVFLTVCLPSVLLVFLAFTVAGHGRLEERKSFATELFNIKNTWRGRPSGAIGFLTIAAILVLAGTVLPFWLKGEIRLLEVALAAAWIFALTAFAFSLVWLVSTFFDLALAARRGAVGLGILLGFGPIALGIALNNLKISTDPLIGTMINPFIPYASSYEMIGLKAAFLVFGAGVCLFAGERRRKKNLEKLQGLGYKVNQNEVPGTAA